VGGRKCDDKNKVVIKSSKGFFPRGRQRGKFRVEFTFWLPRTHNSSLPCLPVHKVKRKEREIEPYNYYSQLPHGEQ